MKPTTWNPGISAKQEGKRKMTGSYSKSTPPREAVKESLLLYVGSTELHEAFQVKVQYIGSAFSGNLYQCFTTLSIKKILPYI